MEKIVKNGFVKIGAFTPEIKVCDVDFNTDNFAFEPHLNNLALQDITDT